MSLQGTRRAACGELLYRGEYGGVKGVRKTTTDLGRCVSRDENRGPLGLQVQWGMLERT
jgi:hypothetical protein